MNSLDRMTDARDRWLFTIEPPSLIDRFLDHPPDGFAAILSSVGTPMFAARLDLLTTVDSAITNRLMRLPLFAVWRRALRWPVAFVGTTVSEYAPLPPVGAEAWLADALRTASSAAPLVRHRLLVIKDLPRDSPLLTAAENAAAEEIFKVLADAGFVLIQGQALAWVPIDFMGIEEYLSRLSAARRRDLRRKLRSRSMLSIEMWSCGDPRLRDGALRADLFELYVNVYRQSLTQFDRLSAAFFDSVLLDATNGGRLFLYRDTGELIGWNLCFERGDTLIDKYIGLAYPQARRRNVYFVSWIVNLEYALAHGLRRYVAGWTDPQVKATLGAQFAFTWHAVRPRSTVLRWALRRLAPWFEGDRASHERRARQAPDRELAG